MASAFFSIASASALPFAKIPAASCSAANLSASALALNASASWTNSNLRASAAFCLLYRSASALCSAAYLSASAVFLIWASSCLSCNSTSFWPSSTSLSLFAMSALTFAILICSKRFCSSIE